MCCDFVLGFWQRHVEVESLPGLQVLVVWMGITGWTRRACIHTVESQKRQLLVLAYQCNDRAHVASYFRISWCSSTAVATSHGLGE